MANEKRLIDANALLEYVERQTRQIPAKEYDNDGFYHYSGWNGACVMARCAIKNAPTVEVVRCKDCKYYIPPEDFDFLGLCTNENICINNDGEIYPKENDFCSYGERKDRW